MEKFLKSIFSPSDKKKGRFESDSEEDRHTPPEPETRRKLSISRSGRMKQANKKRRSLSLELYGESYQTVERPKTVEYHVNNPVTSMSKVQRRRSSVEMTETQDKSQKLNVEVKTPEEEIENAFGIIDKIS